MFSFGSFFIQEKNNRTELEVTELSKTAVAWSLNGFALHAEGLGVRIPAAIVLDR